MAFKFNEMSELLLYTRDDTTLRVSEVDDNGDCLVASDNEGMYETNLGYYRCNHQYELTGYSGICYQTIEDLRDYVRRVAKAVRSVEFKKPLEIPPMDVVNEDMVGQLPKWPHADLCDLENYLMKRIIDRDLKWDRQLNGLVWIRDDVTLEQAILREYFDNLLQRVDYPVLEKGRSTLPESLVAAQADTTTTIAGAAAAATAAAAAGTGIGATPVAVWVAWTLVDPDHPLVYGDPDLLDMRTPQICARYFPGSFPSVNDWKHRMATFFPEDAMHQFCVKHLESMIDVTQAEDGNLRAIDITAPNHELGFHRCRGGRFADGRELDPGVCFYQVYPAVACRDRELLEITARDAELDPTELLIRARVALFPGLHQFAREFPDVLDTAEWAKNLGAVCETINGVEWHYSNGEVAYTVDPTSGTQEEKQKKEKAAQATRRFVNKHKECLHRAAEPPFDAKFWTDLVARHVAVVDLVRKCQGYSVFEPTARRFAKQLARGVSLKRVFVNPRATTMELALPAKNRRLNTLYEFPNNAPLRVGSELVLRCSDYIVYGERDGEAKIFHHSSWDAAPVALTSNLLRPFDEPFGTFTRIAYQYAPKDIREQFLQRVWSKYSSAEIEDGNLFPLCNTKLGSVIERHALGTSAISPAEIVDALHQISGMGILSSSRLGYFIFDGRTKRLVQHCAGAGRTITAAAAAATATMTASGDVERQQNQDFQEILALFAPTLPFVTPITFRDRKWRYLRALVHGEDATEFDLASRGMEHPARLPVWIEGCNNEIVQCFPLHDTCRKQSFLTLGALKLILGENDLCYSGERPQTITLQLFEPIFPKRALRKIEFAIAEEPEADWKRDSLGSPAICLSGRDSRALGFITTPEYANVSVAWQGSTITIPDMFVGSCADRTTMTGSRFTEVFGTVPESIVTGARERQDLLGIANLMTTTGRMLRIEILAYESDVEMVSEHASSMHASDNNGHSHHSILSMHDARSLGKLEFIRPQRLPFGSVRQIPLPRH